MLKTLNRLLLAMLMSAAFVGVTVSILTLFLPDLLGGDVEYETFGHMAFRDDFSLEPRLETIRPSDSPYRLNVTVHTPSLQENDLVVLRIYSGGKELYYTDCLGDFDSTEEYAGLSNSAARPLFHTSTSGEAHTGCTASSPGQAKNTPRARL
ncbi:MAG: hypothetical protein AB1529_05860 [Candidatus Micrarchaeota archaeon]